MPKTVVNGVGLFYDQQGEGTPVLMIGGFLAEHDNWFPLIEALSPQMQCLTFDNRGVGQSDIAPGALTTEVMAEDAYALLQELNIPQAHVIGQSMGTAIAMHLAVKHPECVDKLVLLNPITKLTPLARYVFLGLQAMIHANLPSSLLAQVFLPWSFSEIFLSDEKNVNKILEAWSEDLYPATLEGFHSQFGALEQVDSLAIASDVTQPTLVLAAQNDLLAPPGQAQAISEQISHSDFMIIPSSGHAMHIEHAETCAKHIQRFFA
jgi:pimeloyl-ACP methyl ester carboxylesterase